MKKIIALLMVFCIVIGLCACTLLSPSDTTPASQGNTQNTEEVLLNNETLTVTYIGAKDESSLGVFYVMLKVENKTETEVVINLEDADVDSETIPMITTGVPLKIRPGNSGQTSFIFSMVNLSISSMAEAEKATFRVVARNSDTYETVYESELLTINLR